MNDGTGAFSRFIELKVREGMTDSQVQKLDDELAEIGHQKLTYVQDMTAINHVLKQLIAQRKAQNEHLQNEVIGKSNEKF